MPGLVSHALGASPVLLTDRPMVAQLVDDGLAANRLPAADVRALDFEWNAEAAHALKAEHLGGKAPDVILACDCIFAPLFGSSFLLLEMLCALAAVETTTTLLALERRYDDGAEAFFEQATAAGFASTVQLRCARVLVVEMVRLR